MKHPEHDKLVAIAEGRQMERLFRVAGMADRWEPCSGTMALYIASCSPNSVRIAPGQPAPTKTGTVPLKDSDIWKFWWDKPEVPEGEDDSMEAEFVGACRRVIAEFCRVNGIKPPEKGGV